MVFVPPAPPMVFAVNILCRLFTCKEPYQLPEIVYDNGNDLISANYMNSNRNDIDDDGSGEDNNFFDPVLAPEKNLVETEKGVLEGYYQTTSGGRKIGAFEGIRYGQAHRWEKALATKGWKGVLQAKAPGSDCLQFHVKKLLSIYGKEDCLFLNVYTPVISGNKKNAKLPVVVYIHGGSFLFGSGSDYGPSYLLNEDVVLVNLNYRLGVLGFMSTGDNVLPGNFGLKDQALAIHWVKDNIAAFGGDPDQITLWGLSAGGASVHLHMMSNQTKHLFKRAISQSASAFCHWVVSPPWRARGTTEDLAKYFHCPINNAEEMVRCLKTIDPVSVVAAQVHLLKWIPFPPLIFVPTLELENEEDPGSEFLTEYPEDLYRKGLVEKKPWIVSTTEHEGLSAILAVELLMRWSGFKLYWNKIAKYVLDLDYLELKNVRKIVDKVTRFYLGNRKSTEGTQFDYSNMITDRYFHFPIVKGIQAHSEIAPTYSYYFSFSKGNYSLGNWNLHRPREWGAGHGEDEHYFFNSTINFPGFQRGDPEYKLSKIMLNFATNFVMNGTPTFTRSDSGGNWLKESQLPIWEPVVNPRKISLLQFDEDIKMITPNLKRVMFWESLHLPDAKLWL
ncbi:esterase E4-like [Folsomia candida]|uniref:Carboxylic ester hydrolase n=1 Tax=Folsomia candida TaxID=158441 RepID=A0A226D6R0_FOLCA|nr:esterase E4-like [Folsomia candida]OXA40548.1 Esterase FE4 [Folsomia candida]